MQTKESQKGGNQLEVPPRRCNHFFSQHILDEGFKSKLDVLLCIGSPVETPIIWNNRATMQLSQAVRICIQEL